MLMQDSKRKIAVITPVKHLNLDKLIESKGDVFYADNGSKEEVRDLIINESIDTLLYNPNKQEFCYR